MALLDLTNGFPTIGEWQALSQGDHRYGKIQRVRRSRRARSRRSRLLWWRIYTHRTIFQLNKWMTNATSNYWKTILTAAQRQEWKTLAAGVTIINYKGTSKTPTGFQLYMAANRWPSYSPFNPYQPNANLGGPGFVPNAPATWVQPPVPSVISSELFEDGELFFTCAPIELYWEMNVHAVISAPNQSVGGNRPPTYYHAWMSFYNASPDNVWFSIQTQYPWKPDHPGPACTLGCRFYNTSTGCFGNPLWLAFNP